jgi:hypothetical protein
MIILFSAKNAYCSFRSILLLVCFYSIFSWEARRSLPPLFEAKAVRFGKNEPKLQSNFPVHSPLRVLEAQLRRRLKK